MRRRPGCACPAWARLARRRRRRRWWRRAGIIERERAKE